MDIKLENNELAWENGDLKLVDGLELIKQQILVALFTMLGDWLLDDTKGIDYPRGFREESFLVHDVKKQILGVDGVLQISKIKVKQDGTTINIQAAIETIYGGIDLNEDLKQ